MDNGYLSQYFTAVAVKKLSAVEVDEKVSHQHEFNGSSELKKVIWESERTEFETKFLWIGDENEGISDEGKVTWYDSRISHPVRSEFRLYFKGNECMSLAMPDDTLFIARRTDNSLLIIIARGGSTIENQLYWLFGLKFTGNEGKFNSKVIHDQRMDYAAGFILDELNIEINDPESDRLDDILMQFRGAFPSTSVFSNTARASIKNQIDPVEDPDAALVSFMEWEEKLFRRLERVLMLEKLTEFSSDFYMDKDATADGIMRFSLSLHNRRKSRAGLAFEDHFAYILNANGVKFSRKNETEYKAKPDFLFPGINAYRNSSVPDDLLSMVGAKTTCKDRWRQILSEAARIQEKHLLTMEPGISLNQTKEMKSNSIQLILPKSIHSSYTEPQQSELMSVRDFIRFAKDKQHRFERLGE